MVIKLKGNKYIKKIFIDRNIPTKAKTRDKSHCVMIGYE
ncbi:MAG: tRNA lysidine(34) synthetase TilS [Ignavibacteriae bacterium]|nr:tRNA lysidine(34) synthetase TilS [Ignavibacteriota bacterium]